MRLGSRSEKRQASRVLGASTWSATADFLCMLYRPHFSSPSSLLSYFTSHVISQLLITKAFYLHPSTFEIVVDHPYTPLGDKSLLHKRTIVELVREQNKMLRLSTSFIPVGHLHAWRCLADARCSGEFLKYSSIDGMYC
jgi:hypothetical protein